MTEWTKHWSEDGILSDAGMVPLPAAEMEEMIYRMESLPPLTADALKKKCIIKAS